MHLGPKLLLDFKCQSLVCQWVRSHSTAFSSLTVTDLLYFVCNRLRVDVWSPHVLKHQRKQLKQPARY